MVIEKVLYKKTFNLGNYSTHTIGIEIGLDPGEDAKEALKTAHDLCHEYHRETFDNGLDHQHIELRTIPDIQVEKEPKINYDTVIEEINKCQTKDELKGWQPLAFGNTESIKAFTNKLKELQT